MALLGNPKTFKLPRLDIEDTEIKGGATLRVMTLHGHGKYAEVLQSEKSQKEDVDAAIEKAGRIDSVKLTETAEMISEGRVIMDKEGKDALLPDRIAKRD
jgi:hypothetical protein